MKKIIVVLCLMFMATTMVSAQRAEARKNEIKTGLKEQVMLTEDQITSVMQIEEEFRPKLRAVKSDATLSEDEKKVKSKAINDEKKLKIESTLGKEKADKVQAFYSTLKKAGKDSKQGDSGTITK